MLNFVKINKDLGQFKTGELIRATPEQLKAAGLKTTDYTLQGTYADASFKSWLKDDGTVDPETAPAPVAPAKP